MLTALCLPHIQCLTIYGRNGRVTARGETAIKDRLIEHAIESPPPCHFDQREPCHSRLHYARVHLVCPQCEGRLSKGEAGIHLLPLPGAQWQELVDCWSCHRSEFAVVTTRLSWDGPTGHLLPRPTCALLGGFWLTVCASDLVLADGGGSCSCSSHRRAHWERLGEEHWRVPLSELVCEQGKGAPMAVSNSKVRLSLPALIRDELDAIWDSLCARKVIIGVERSEDAGDTRAGQILHLECLAPRAFVYEEKRWREGSLIKWRADTENPVPLNIQENHNGHDNRNDHVNGNVTDIPLLRWPLIAYNQLVVLLCTPCPVPLVTRWECKDIDDDYQVAFLACP